VDYDALEKKKTKPDVRIIGTNLKIVEYEP
jgi:hypothetical protein